MPYIVMTSSDGKEIGRRALKPSDLLIVGRSTDCDIRVRDIMLSREHCGIEEGDGGWVAVDLDSRNGTFVNGKRVTRQKLEAGDKLYAGRTTIEFFLGEMPKPDPSKKQGPPERPADPFEALSSTVTDFEFKPEFEAPVERPIRRPTPKPMPVARRDKELAAQASASALALELADDPEHGRSSPTWATKAPSRAATLRAVTERYVTMNELPAPVAVASRHEARVSARAKAPAKKAWDWRLKLVLLEVIAAALLIATTILALVATLS
jgi:predicted component of type VI protein secretion system